MAGEAVMESLANRLLDLDGRIERHITEEETLRFVESKKNENTKAKTNCDLKKLKNWLSEDGESRQIEDIPARELDVYFASYLLSVRKTGSKENYEPSTLRGFKANLSRYLTSKNYPEDVHGKLFRQTRDVLKAKCLDLKEQGKGNIPNRAEAFTISEIRLMEDQGILGSESPQSLLNSMWLNNTMHFGLRGRQEHQTMMWGDVELERDASGLEYLKFTERATKTRKGLVGDSRQFMPKIFEQKGDDNCPVKLYKLYTEMRPLSTLRPDSKFYLSVNQWYGKGSSSSHVWYNAGPMGKNMLGKIAKNMSEQAGLPGRHTNHSARRTSITSLLNAGCPPTEVAQLSGHKNLMSLNHYHTLSIDQQHKMSSIIHARGTDGNTSCTSKRTATRTQTGKEITQIEIQMEDDLTDEELVVASQEIEASLEDIFNAPQGTVLNLPVMQSPGGSLKCKDPFSLFHNCTFQGNVTINMK